MEDLIWRFEYQTFHEASLVHMTTQLAVES